MPEVLANEIIQEKSINGLIDLKKGKALFEVDITTSLEIPENQ